MYHIINDVVKSKEDFVEADVCARSIDAQARQADERPSMMIDRVLSASGSCLL
jgi:hypothetical protein